MPFLLIIDPGADSRQTDLSAGLANLPGQSGSNWRIDASAEHALAVAPPTACVSASARNIADCAVSVVLDGFLSNQNRLLHDTGVAPGGHDAAARCVLALYQRHGERLNRYLQGHYAGLVIDSARQRVLGFRDRVGGRVMYWHRARSLRAFSNRGALIAALPRVPFVENEHFIAELFARAKPALPGSTAFANIQELKPGETLDSTDQSDTTRRQPFEFDCKPDFATDSDYIARFRKRFDEAVAGTLPAAGGTAVMLSGGLDSPPCLASADRQIGAADRRPCAVSWSLPNHPEADETDWIRSITRHLEVEEQIFDGEALLPFSGLGVEAVNPDIPLLNAYQPVVHECYRLAAERGCSVVLNGSAGDQIYPDYRLLLVDPLRRGRLGLAWRQFRDWVVAGGLTDLLSDPALRRLGAGVRRALPGRRRGTRPVWVTDEAWRLLPEPQLWPPEAAEHRYPEYAARLFGNTMAFGRAHGAASAERFGVQRREPFQNESLFRLMLELPVHLSLRGGQTKWIMRQAMRDSLPEAVLNKNRTGLLYSFLQSGLEANRDHLHQILFEQDRHWMHYAPAELVHTALHAPDALDRHRVVMSIAVSYSLWRQFWNAR